MLPRFCLIRQRLYQSRVNSFISLNCECNFGAINLREKRITLGSGWGSMSWGGGNGCCKLPHVLSEF